MHLTQHAHDIKIIGERLHDNVDSIKMIVKHFSMMGNQIEQLISMQNKIYVNLIANEKQVCGVNTRGGSATQDPDYPDGHPKRKEQDALKAKKSSAGKSPNDNENEESGNSEEQENEISLSDAETEDNNNEDEVSSPINEDHQESDNEEPSIREDPQSSNTNTKKKKHP